MHNAGIRRNDSHVAECDLSPSQERITLLIAQEFQFRIQRKRLHIAEIIHLHGMVDDQFCGLQRIDQRWIAAQVLHRIAHCGEIDDGRDTGEILHQDAAGSERDFLVRFRVAVP